MLTLVNNVLFSFFCSILSLELQLMVITVAKGAILETIATTRFTKLTIYHVN